MHENYLGIVTLTRDFCHLARSPAGPLSAQNCLAAGTNVMERDSLRSLRTAVTFRFLCHPSVN
jgi:hypothetical protein